MIKSIKKHSCALFLIAISVLNMVGSSQIAEIDGYIIQLQRA